MSRLQLFFLKSKKTPNFSIPWSLKPIRTRRGPAMARQGPLATRSHTSLSQGDNVTCENGAFDQLENTIDDTEEPHSLSLEQKVASQLEHYLSDSYLAEDGFLLKHVQRNKLRYVSLKLLTSFRKIRELTRDWHVTAAAACASPLLQVNEEGTKVRREEPLPTWLLGAPTSRLLLAWNLSCVKVRGDTQEPREPLEQPKLLESILRVFSAYGDINSVRVLHPGKEVPLDLRRHARTNRELGHRLCAVVEFHSLEGSRRAHRALTAEEGKSGGGGLHVAALGSHGKSTMDSSHEEAPDGNPPESPALLPEACPGEQRRNSEHLTKDANSGSTPHRRPNPRFPWQFPRGRAQRPKAPLMGDRCPARNPCCSGDTGAPVVPWVQRRKVAAGHAHGGKGGKTVAPQRTLRRPAGPDGTAGFQRSGRGRGRPLQRDQ